MIIGEYISFIITKCLYYFDWPNLEGWAEILQNNFVVFLENLRHHSFFLRLSDLYNFGAHTYLLNCENII